LLTAAVASGVRCLGGVGQRWLCTKFSPCPFSIVGPAEQIKCYVQLSIMSMCSQKALASTAARPPAVGGVARRGPCRLRGEVEVREGDTLLVGGFNAHSTF